MNLQVFGSGRYWYVRARYGNGIKALVSESYVSRANAERAKRAMLKGGSTMKKKKSKKGGRPC